MRTPISITIGLAASLLTGCVGWTGTSALKSPDQDVYSGYVETSPAVFVGVMPAMAYPMAYNVGDCFNPPETVKDVPGLIVGSHPLDVVCRQYQGVDLRKYPPTTAACFVADEGGERLEPPMLHIRPYKHPWLTPNPSAECAKLIADIQVAKKSK